jgi:Tfp pilus assembly protein PilN
MTRFDYLHDGLPDAIDTIRTLRLPRRLRTVAATLATLLGILAVSAVFEAIRVSSATAVEQREQVRLDSARTRLAAADLELQAVDKLLETDRRLRAVRRSGTTLVSQLTRIGNLVPRGVWLSSVEPSPEGLVVEGDAVNVGALDKILGNLVTNPGFGGTRLVRMTRIARTAGSALVSFTLQLQVDP